MQSLSLKNGKTADNGETVETVKTEYKTVSPYPTVLTVLTVTYRLVRFTVISALGYYKV